MGNHGQSDGAVANTKTSTRHVEWYLQDVSSRSVSKGRRLLNAVMQRYDLTELRSVTIGRNMKNVISSAAKRCEGKLCGLHHYYINSHAPRDCRIYINLDGSNAQIDVTLMPCPVSSIQESDHVLLPSGKKLAVEHGAIFKDKEGNWRQRCNAVRPLPTPDEQVLWVGLHELYHFLRFTKQIKGIDNDLYADQFADYVFDVLTARDSLHRPVRSCLWLIRHTLDLAQYKLLELRSEWPLPIPEQHRKPTFTGTKQHVMASSS